MYKFPRLPTVALFLVVASGCASGPAIRTDKDPSTDLSAYKTFGFYDPLATDRAGYSTLLTGHLKRATRTQLERLGYVYDESEPQLRVNFYVNITEKQQIRATPAGGPGFYGYRLGGYRTWSAYPYNVDTVEYEAGTLSVDLVDASRKSLVWQGVAQGKVRKEAYRDPAAAIDSAVTEIFRRFPSPPSS